MKIKNIEINSSKSRVFSGIRYITDSGQGSKNFSITISMNTYHLEDGFKYIFTIYESVNIDSFSFNFDPLNFKESLW